MFTLVAFKNLFFDRAAVKGAVDRGALRALSKFGAYVRRRDKSSMKYKKGGARPGGPPHVHKRGGFTRAKKNRKTGVTSKQAVSPLRELTLFGYDPARKSVVIGAALFKSRVGGGVVPRVVEEGGVGPYFARGKRLMKANEPRPHLVPAFDYERLSPMFKDKCY